MKKKIAALLTAALVMTMSASTVFAAVSPDMNTVATTVTTGAVTAKDGATVTANSTAVTDTNATNSAASAAKAAMPSNVENAKVEVLTDITISGTTVSETNPVTIELNVGGATTDKNVKVLNYHSGAWHEVEASIIGAGKVSATFTHLSPVMVVTYTVAQASTGGSSWFYDPAIDGPQSSPKTGVLPVAAMTAGICLAGAAVCGKKVKFN